MKKYNTIFSIILIFASIASSFAQKSWQHTIQNYRLPGLDGVNVYEDPKTDTIAYDGLKVRVGGDFALQFQAIDHSTGSQDTLYKLANDFNLPTANLNLDVQLYDGVMMHLRSYLSSRHHEEAWVKGGHIQVDKLEFIKEGFLSNIMNMLTLRVGLDEINYGDAHFRRTDNARATYNPFVGNYIMDAFATEAFGEALFRYNGAILLLAVSNGKLNQSVTTNSNTDNKISFYGKVGYDSQINEDLRVRLTASWYTNKGTSTGANLYGGDRSGARYYSVLLQNGAADNFRSGRFNPAFKQLTAIQINPFVKFQGIELFGIYEMANGGDKDGNGNYTQMAVEALYRFGNKENLYVGGRYNNVSGKQTDASDDRSISRINIGGGWYMTKNVMAKLEYVKQNYSGDGWSGKDAIYKDGEFKGIMLEATIGF